MKANTNIKINVLSIYNLRSAKRGYGTTLYIIHYSQQTPKQHSNIIMLKMHTFQFCLQIFSNHHIIIITLASNTVTVTRMSAGCMTFLKCSAQYAVMNMIMQLKSLNSFQPSLIIS